MTSDRGAVTVLGLFLVAVVAVVGVGTAEVGFLYAERERATTAAEAAALAAAVSTYPPASAQSPRQAAALFAARNGARLERCVCPRDSSLAVRTVLVMVSVDVELPLLGNLEVIGAARAEFDPQEWLGR